jgi:hypothetical protein
MWVQVLLYIITLSTYSGYWFYVTSKEMSEHLGRQDPARPKDEVLMWTLLLCLPPFSLYSMYKQGELFEIFTSKSVERWLILLLWIFFPPAVWFIIQRKLNETAA